MFKECRVEEMPPHIYAVAASAHRAMLATRKDQSLLFIGRSGTGKTSNLKHALNYYSYFKHSSPGVTSTLTPDKVNAASVLLEALGNTRTVMNANATRFSSIYSVDFDSSGNLASASVQTMLLEKSRVVRRPDGEPTFNIFYQMLAGLDGRTRKELHLENLNEPNLFMTPLTRIEDKSKASSSWNRILTACNVLDITPAESNALWAVLAAIYHLGTASVAKGSSPTNGGHPPLASTKSSTQFGRPAAAQRAASCLGTTVEELTRAVFQGSVSSSTINRKLRSADRESANLPDGIEKLEGFVCGLYQEVFNAAVYLINR